MVLALILRGIALDAVFDKAEIRVQPPCRKVVGDDKQLKQFDALAGMLDDRLDQRSANSRRAVIRADVHAPEQAFVTVLRPGLHVKARDPDQIWSVEGADDEVVGQPRREPFERLTLFALQRAAEGMRAIGQRLQADFPVDGGVFRTEPTQVDWRGAHGSGSPVSLAGS